MWASRYGLTWFMNPNVVPQPDQPIALTVAGMRHLDAATPLLSHSWQPSNFLSMCSVTLCRPQRNWSLCP